MATKTSRASIAQKRKVKNQRRAVKAQKRNAAANQCKAKASVNNYSNPKTNEMVIKDEKVLSLHQQL